RAATTVGTLAGAQFAPFAAASDDVSGVATEVGAGASGVVGDAAVTLNEVSGGRLGEAAGIAARPLAGTVFLAGQGQDAAEDVNNVTEQDVEDATDQFIANAAEGNPNVTGGPLPVFSVASPGGVQTFVSGSDDAVSASQLADDATTSGTAGAGGAASGGGTGTATAAATEGTMETAAFATAGAFADELEVTEGGLFVDEQRVEGTGQQFVDEMQVPDPQAQDVGPLGVPELGVQIGAGENSAPWEIDELEPTSMFVNEMDVPETDDDTPTATTETSAVGSTTGGSSVGNQPGSNMGPDSGPGSDAIGGETSEGGGFDVGGRTGSGLVVGSDSGVRFVGRRPDDEGTLQDATEEFFAIDFTDTFTTDDVLDQAQQTEVGSGDASSPFAGTTTTEDTDSAETGEWLPFGEETAGGGIEGAGETFSEPGADTNDGTGLDFGPDYGEGVGEEVGVDAGVDAAVDAATTSISDATATETTGVDSGFGEPTEPGFGEPNEFAFEFQFEYGGSEPGRPRQPRPDLDDEGSGEEVFDVSTAFSSDDFDTGIATVEELEQQMEDFDKQFEDLPF
ncbi:MULTISPECIES: hypothetical protein, partial [Halobacterium]|uniref:hypothetical protein n=1 Tax=Halobacterium TaxID=2239 RepID=UPI0018D250BE